MSPETCRKLKTFLMLAMLSVAEGRRVVSRILLSGSQLDGAALNANGGAEEGVHNGREHKRLATNPKIMQPGKLAIEQLKSILEVPDQQGHSKRFADQIHAMLTAPKFQKQADYALEEWLSIMEDPGLQQEVHRFPQVLHALATHPKKFVAEELKNQDVWERAELDSEQPKAIIRDPLLQENSKLFAKRMQAVMADSEIQQHTKLASEQLKMVMEDTRLQKKSDAFAELMGAVMTDQKVVQDLLMEAISEKQTRVAKGEAPSLVEVSRKFIPPLKSFNSKRLIPLSSHGREGEPRTSWQMTAMRNRAQPGWGELQKRGSNAPFVQPLTLTKGIRSRAPSLVNVPDASGINAVRPGLHGTTAPRGGEVRMDILEELKYQLSNSDEEIRPASDLVETPIALAYLVILALLAAGLASLAYSDTQAKARREAALREQEEAAEMLRARGLTAEAKVLERDLKKESTLAKPKKPKENVRNTDPYGDTVEGNRFVRRQGRSAKRAKAKKNRDGKVRR